MTIHELHRRLQSFDIVQAAGNGLEQNQQKVLDINREQLYEKGIGNDGQPLPPYKSNPYARKKERMRGKSIVDIWLKGKLQEEMELKVSGDTYSIFSRVPYAQYVVGIRPTIFGLTDDGKIQAWSIVRNDVVQSLQKHLFS